MKYILFTNVWNNEDDIERTFKMVSGFTMRPDLWVWIDDGSIDATKWRILDCIDKYKDLSVKLVSTLPKDRGSLSTIGRAWNFAFRELKIKDMDFDFLSLIDVDNEIHKEYHSFAAKLFHTFPYIGVISGYHPDEPTLKMPKGNGKCTRWDIIKHIDKFWDPAPDTFINIIAKSMGYEWCIMDNIYGELKGECSSRHRTEAGSEYAGKLHAYVGASVWSALLRVGHRGLKRKYARAFWRGYRNNKDWRCEDTAILDYYRGWLD